MISKTVTDDATTGLKKAEVTLTLPAIPLTVFVANENLLDSSIKDEYVVLITKILRNELGI